MMCAHGSDGAGVAAGTHIVTRGVQPLFSEAGWIVFCCCETDVLS